MPSRRTPKRQKTDASPGRPKALQAAFLAAYEQCGNISHAARLANCSRDNHYLWLGEPEYVEKFKDAHRTACDSLETEARRRAVEGVLEPVYQGGKMVGGVRKFSDHLLMFLLKGAMPDKYKERVQFDVKQLDDAIAAELARVATRGEGAIAFSPAANAIEISVPGRAAELERAGQVPDGADATPTRVPGADG